MNSLTPDFFSMRQKLINAPQVHLGPARRQRPAFSLWGAAIGATLWLPFAASGHPDSPSGAKITSVVTGGVGYVSSTTTASGVNADIGRWDTPFPNGVGGAEVPGLEPDGASTLTVNIDVGTGGTLVFDYAFRTYDAGIYDWLDIWLDTPGGTVTIADRYGKPGSVYGDFWAGTLVTYSLKFDRSLMNKQVVLHVSVQQDGWGDQTQAQIFNLKAQGCPVAELTPITDPTALSFEAGNDIDTADLDPTLASALADFQAAVEAAGGHFHLNSAYRPPEYQRHLREVWDKWDQLKNNTDPLCADLKEEIRTEFFTRHQLKESQRPASDSGPHTQGNAFDASISGISPALADQLANQNGLHRPIPVNDPIHYTLE